MEHTRSPVQQVKTSNLELTDMHWLGLFCDTACQWKTTAMNHINIVVAGQTHPQEQALKKEPVYLHCSQ